jgi:anti-sigma B factor antagonist
VSPARGAAPPVGIRSAVGYINHVPSVEVITEERPDGIDRVALSGEVDVASVELVHSHLEAAFRRGTRWLLIDLTALKFMDSSLLLAITRAVRRTRAVGGDVMLVCVDANLCRIVEIYGLSRHVDVHETVEDAAQALRTRMPRRGRRSADG